jgi:hypothetical protein
MQGIVLVLSSKEVSASHVMGHSAKWELGEASSYVRIRWGEFQQVPSCSCRYCRDMSRFILIFVGVW